MKIFFSFLILIFFILVCRLFIHFGHVWRRKKATKLHPDETLVRMANSFGVKIQSNKPFKGGPMAGTVVVGLGRMVLTDKRLVLATHIGRILELSESNRGLARAVGPKRLVILGKHPNGTSELRLELVIPEEEEWARLINESFKSETITSTVIY